jgi:hypothetical protein
MNMEALTEIEINEIKEAARRLDLNYDHLNLSDPNDAKILRAGIAYRQGQAYPAGLQVGDIFYGAGPEAEKLFPTDVNAGVDRKRNLYRNMFLHGALDAFDRLKVYLDSDNRITRLEVI